MVISRPSTDQIAVRAAQGALQPDSQIVVEQGDCCIATLHGQALGKVDPGHWTLQLLPFCQQLLGAPNGGELFYVFTRPFPPQIASTFSARVAGEQGLTVLDGIECWIYQHGLRHMGEIELARSFVGLTGLTS